MLKTFPFKIKVPNQELILSSKAETDYFLIFL